MLMKVFIAIALALTTALVASSVAFAVVVQIVEGESMSPSTSQAGPFTGVGGVSMMRWNSGATTNAVASAQVDLSASVEQLVVRARQGASGGGTLAVLLDGQVVRTFSPSTSGFAPHTITLANPLSAGSHTLVIRPNATLPVRADVDYVELHDTGGTLAACADGQDNDFDGSVDYPNDPGCLSNTDNDETNTTTTSARLVGAGDIATNGTADTATGDLIDARPDARVFTAGDNAYPDGTASDFTNKYHPAWGPFKNRTSPSPGNHDYHTSGASGYKNYFGSVAGLRSVNPTYYAYTLGAWRVYALDSNLTDEAMTDQVNWLANDMATNDALCEVSYYHHPVASSGQHGPETNMSAAMWVFDESGGDLALTGHDHNYERFGKVDGNGEPSDTGFVNIVVGTGGTGLRGQGFLQPGSVVRNFNTHGIVDITLSSTGYSGRFVPVPGKTFTDPFSGTCGTN
jgi:hypothetical protein